MTAEKPGMRFFSLDMTEKSISRNLALSLSLIIFLVLTGLLVFMYANRSREMLAMLEVKADEHISRLVGILTIPLWNIDTKSITGISTEFAHNDLVEYVLITDDKGMVYFESGFRDITGHSIQKTGEILFNNQIIGHAEIVLSLNTFRKTLLDYLLTAVEILTAAVFIISVATGWLMRVFLRRPLNDLCEGMDQLATGSFPKKSRAAVYVELSGIIERFTEMAGRVRYREKAFVHANQKLREEIAYRKRIEEALKESESKFRNLYNVSPQCIMLAEIETGRLADVNQEFCRLAGIERHEAIGKSPVDLGLFTEERWTHLIRLLNLYHEIRERDYDFTVSGEEIRHTLMSAKTVRLAGRRMIFCVFLDITTHRKALAEREELRERLARSRKMEALGLLAGGVAHDLNNILSGIVSYPDLIMMDLPEDSRLMRPVKTIKESGQRAAAVVSDLLTLARGIASTREIRNLNDLVKEYLESPEFAELSGRHPQVSIHTDLEDSDIRIRCSPVHLKKVLMNLISNAFESLEKEGRVEIATRLRFAEKGEWSREEPPDGEYAILTVSDEGCGISAEDLERIFEPFYTRKEMGRSGSGLGLAVVWNTVRDHDGYIEVHSGNQGTVFEISLPIADGRQETLRRMTAVEEITGNGERILVVDDEENQRMIACEMLNRLGYAVEAVGSGEAAVQYLKRQPADLVLLDMIMPGGMSGRETYEEITQSINPEQKAVIASGFAETRDVKTIQAMGAGQFIKKPYTLEHLGIAIRMELDKSDA